MIGDEADRFFSLSARTMARLTIVVSIAYVLATVVIILAACAGSAYLALRIVPAVWRLI